MLGFAYKQFFSKSSSRKEKSNEKKNVNF